MSGTNKLTIVERTNRNHRQPIIIRDLSGMWTVASFDTIEQLDFFANTVGFTYEAVEWRETELYGMYREYKLSHRIISDPHGAFWKSEDVPAGAKPIKALSNGSIVTCYFVNDGEAIIFYRPNPNAHAVYHPLSIEEHIAHQKVYGSY